MPPDAKSRLTGKDPEVRQDWGQEEKGVTEDEWLDGINNSVDMSLSKLQEMVKDREAWCMGSQRVRHNLVTIKVISDVGKEWFGVGSGGDRLEWAGKGGEQLRSAGVEHLFKKFCS